jgi:hypothetical protein
MDPIERPIRAAHAEYCAFVGGDSYPVSVEFALCVAELHRRHKFRSACDIGSGFTSWLLRRLQIPDVVTFDAESEWQERTMSFLAERAPGDELTMGQFREWPLSAAHFLAKTRVGPEMQGFDLVIYDSAAKEGLPRDPEIPLVASMVAPGGYLLVDDFNWPEYSGFVKGYFTALGWPWSAIVESRDKFGRFAGLVGPKP